MIDMLTQLALILCVVAGSFQLVAFLYRNVVGILFTLAVAAAVVFMYPGLLV